MSLFRNNAKEAAPMTGPDVLRAALRARKGHASLLARDLGIGVAALDAFAYDAGNLPDAILTALAQRFFGDSASYDPEKNLLKRTEQVPLPAAVRPPQYVPKQVDFTMRLSGTPQPQAEPKGRPGWVK